MSNTTIIGTFKTQNELLKAFPKTKNYELKEIFENHWEDFLIFADENNLYIRNAVFTNVDKMLKCGTGQLGHSIFKCPICQNETIVNNTCKCRFCPSCSVKYSNQRTESIMEHLYNVPHRHLVFTCSDILWPYFRKDRSLLHLMFLSVNEVLSSFFNKIKKKEKFKGGFILVLHTFGRDDKWNVHIHALIAEMAISDKSHRKVDFFPYDLLRKSFQTVLLNLMEEKIGKDEFRKVKNEIYSKSENGFYVRAKKEDYKNKNSIDVVKYILRYCGRPPFASYRILDISDKDITFFYQRHEDDLFVVEKISIFDFIKRIIIHIPEAQFKTIRYYGFYNKKPKLHDIIKLLIDKVKAPFYKQLNTYRMMMIKTFNIDPLICSKCGSTMEFDKLIC